MKRFRRSYPKLIQLSKLISLTGKRTLITGAASGIDRAATRRFAEAGSELILVDIDEKGLNEIKNNLRDYPQEKRIFVVDLSKKEQVDKLWDSFGQVVPDILINNAGIYPFADYLKISEEFYSKTLDVNLNSVFWMCQNFIKRRLDRGGIIINVSTIEAILPFKADLAHYGISKSGVIALTRSLARDYGKNNFRINVILPGAIKTPGTDSLVKKAISRLRFDLIKTGYDFQTRLALGRWGDPDEVAKVALFLSSDLASYVHGAMIPVDGGFLSS